MCSESFLPEQKFVQLQFRDFFDMSRSISSNVLPRVSGTNLQINTTANNVSMLYTRKGRLRPPLAVIKLRNVDDMRRLNSQLRAVEMEKNLPLYFVG